MWDLQQQQADLEVRLRQTSITPQHKRCMVWTPFATLLQHVQWHLLHIVTVTARAIDIQLQLPFSITVLSSCWQQLLLAHMHAAALVQIVSWSSFRLHAYALP